MCGGGGSNPISSVAKSAEKRVKEIGQGEFKDAGKKILRGAAAVTGGGAAALSESLNFGAEKVGEIKQAQTDAIDAAKGGAEAAKEQLNIQKEEIKKVREEKQDELKTNEQQKASEAAGKRRDTARRRQRNRALGASGRRSTILTSGVDNSTQGTRKTLLGQ